MFYSQSQEVCGAADAGIVGTNEAFAVIGDLLFVIAENGGNPADQVEFDLSLILGSGRYDFCGRNFPELIHFVAMEDESSRGFCCGATGTGLMVESDAGWLESLVCSQDLEAFFEGVNQFQATGDDGLEGIEAGSFKLNFVCRAAGGFAEVVAIEADAGEWTDVVAGLIGDFKRVQGCAVCNVVFFEGL